ncbi:hypothetical protein PIB30_033456 [Stylosanthes scabra]|uniref:Uncharacterized protein n=1 Tax=Stylosanthes scabra TaxID=79078 RepID=A0ABU6VB92_9FABA|nr:hypothetical protein [Stylosanthes scabra]
MAKGKVKLCQSPTQASPRLVALRSNTVVQILTPGPDVPVKETVTASGGSWKWSGPPKNDVYDELWAMLDAESNNEAEEIPREWDLDSTLLNWGRNEPNVGPDGPDQGPPPAEI